MSGKPRPAARSRTLATFCCRTKGLSLSIGFSSDSLPTSYTRRTSARRSEITITFA